MNFQTNYSLNLVFIILRYLDCLYKVLVWISCPHLCWNWSINEFIHFRDCSGKTKCSYCTNDYEFKCLSDTSIHLLIVKTSTGLSPIKKYHFTISISICLKWVNWLTYSLDGLVEIISRSIILTLKKMGLSAVIKKIIQIKHGVIWLLTP